MRSSSPVRSDDGIARSTRPGGREWLWFLACALCSSACCVSAARHIGVTWDEPFYLTSGLARWHTGSYRLLMKAGTMPLPVDVQTLPLYVWERWSGRQFEPAADCERILPVARSMTLPFWWLLLYSGWQLGRRLAGPWGAALAVALLACEPNLLAHAGLATTDIAISACLLAFVYVARAGETGGWIRRVLVPALWFGAAVLAKASALVFAPLCLVVLQLDRAFRVPAGSDLPAAHRLLGAFRHNRRDVMQIIGLGLVLVFLYVGSDWQSERSFTAWAHELPCDAFGRSMAWLADHLCIFPNAGEGLVQQIKHNIRGHSVYLLGEAAPRAVWYYFPVLLTIKLSLPVLLAFLVLLLLRPRALANVACLLAAALIVFSLSYRVQIGIRIVLPVVVVGLVGLAAALADVLRTAPTGWGKRLAAAACVALCCGTLGSTVLAWPNELSFVNRLWGGTNRGYLVVSESNYDWGQGVKELLRWRRKHGIGSLDLWYFGTDPAARRPPLHPVELHAPSVRGPRDLMELEHGRYLAVSATLLYGSYINTDAGRALVRYLRALPPVGRTTTFFIFDFTHVRSAGSRLRASDRPV